MLSGDLSDQLEPESEGATPRITLVVNSDSLHTWALPGLVGVAEHVQLTILREDQEHSLDLVRRGAAHGAVTATATPLPGCTSRPLGLMRYWPVCTPAFTARWFADGVTGTSLAAAPVVVYDEKDDLQDRYLARGRRTPLHPPRHYVPATHEFGRAVQLGLGWGMLPELQIAQLEPGTLTRLTPSAHLDVPRYWQQWRLTTTALDYVASAITDAARHSSDNPTYPAVSKSGLLPPPVLLSERLWSLSDLSKFLVDVCPTCAPGRSPTGWGATNVHRVTRLGRGVRMGVVAAFAGFVAVGYASLQL